MLNLLIHSCLVAVLTADLLQAVRNLFPFIQLKPRSVRAVSVATAGTNKTDSSSDHPAPAAEEQVPLLVWSTLCRQVLIADTSANSVFVAIPADLKQRLKEEQVAVENNCIGSKTKVTEADELQAVVFEAKAGQKFIPSCYKVTLNAGAIRAGKLLGKICFAACVVTCLCLLAGHGQQLAPLIDDSLPLCANNL